MAGIDHGPRARRHFRGIGAPARCRGRRSAYLRGEERDREGLKGYERRVYRQIYLEIPSPIRILAFLVRQLVGGDIDDCRGEPLDVFGVQGAVARESVVGQQCTHLAQLHGSR